MAKLMIKFFQMLGYAIIVAAIIYPNYLTDDSTVYLYMFHIPSLVLVGGGLIGFLLANNPTYQIAEMLRCLFKMSSVNLRSQMKDLTLIKKITDEYYEKGPESLISNKDNKDLPATWKSAFEKIGSKVPIDDVIKLAKFEYEQRYEKIDDSIYSLKRISSLAPSLGMFGTILGLIKLLKDLSDYNSIGANMSLALITTLYGILFSIAFVDPLINKLDVYKVVRRKNYDLLIWWLYSIKDRKPTLYFKGTLLAEKEGKNVK
jgi:chemotaxis protein MotA